MRTSQLSRCLLPVILLLCLAAPAARAAESETHIFDEALSLTGSCSTDNFDLLPDPGCLGGVHPPEPFASPSSVTTDPHGDIYVVSNGKVGPGGAVDERDARIDIFDPDGTFLTELAVEGAREAGVDAEGHLYVTVFCAAVWECYGEPDGAAKFLRFDPTEYDPAAQNIEYNDPPVELPLASGYPPGGIAIDPRNQHVFASYVGPEGTQELDAPVDGQPNEVLEERIAAGDRGRPGSLALDVARGLLYAADQRKGEGGIPAGDTVIHVYEVVAPHKLVRTIDGSTTPAGHFLSVQAKTSVAVDEGTGNLFVGDVEGGSRVYEFEPDGSYVWTFKHGFTSLLSFIHVDNSPESPNQGYLFVPAGYTGVGHSFAFKPKPVPHPPVIEGVAVVDEGEREAVLQATINPEGFATHYSFEYTTQAAYEEHGFEGAVVAGEGTLAPAVSGRQVSTPLSGLSPGTAYRFRVLAESQCEAGGCGDEADGSFATFVAPSQGGSCGNAALRTGSSANLPDCRAYELVTPSDTNGQAPEAPGANGAVVSGVIAGGAPTMRADGQAIPFATGGGSLLGTNTAGGLGGSIYVATRTSAGWQIASRSPTGEESPSSEGAPKAISADLGYVAWVFPGEPGDEPIYLRYPDGSLHLIGEGPLATKKRVNLRSVAPEASHVIFVSPIPLVEGAPGAPNVIYDKTPDGVLHVVSLLPGDVPPSGGADHRGLSTDGSAVAFTVGSSSPLYVRIDNARTVAAAPEGSEFAGFTDNGRHLFYVTAGDLFRIDVQTEETIEVATTGDAEPVNVPRQGGGVYFISGAELGEANPQGDEAVGGQPNLYYWDSATTHFVATVTDEDLQAGTGGFQAWMDGVGGNQLAYTPARTSLDGSTLLFRSRARITNYDPEGHSEIYRYDSGRGTLSCLSCNPIGSAAISDAKFVTLSGVERVLGTKNAMTANLSDDGARAFFETSDRLVPADNDGRQDVYEWEEEGKGSCRQPAGCIFLISSGESARPNFFYGASGTGDDVAISSSDLLTSADGDETSSIYDVRVGGGFPAVNARRSECLGEACQPAAQSLPDPPVSLRGARNVPPQKARLCPKGKRWTKARRRCVRTRHHRHKQAQKSKGGR